MCFSIVHTCRNIKSNMYALSCFNSDCRMLRTTHFFCCRFVSNFSSCNLKHFFQLWMRQVSHRPNHLLSSVNRSVREAPFLKVVPVFGHIPLPLLMMRPTQREGGQKKDERCKCLKLPDLNLNISNIKGGRLHWLPLIILRLCGDNE